MPNLPRRSGQVMLVVQEARILVEASMAGLRTRRNEGNQKGNEMLRPYQQLASDSIIAHWEKNQSTMVVMPTGSGKTVLFADIVKRRLPGRALVLAHREELIFQAKDKIERFTGLECEIEMGELTASKSFWSTMPVVIATVQTLVSGRVRPRMEKFNPADFSTIVIDEFHHATANTYVKILDYFKSNPDIKILGVTATPDRTDEEALGQVCDSVAFNYSITEAIGDGWLVPISCQMVSIAGLDFSSVRTTAGDLNGADLAAIMEAEEVCQGVCSATLDIIGDKQTIVFTPSVKHAEMACAIFNRHKAGIAEWVSGKTEKEARRKIMDNVVSGKTQILCNVGVATEGFDAPGVEVIVMARPTKSRALYAQMAGRATRPQAGLVDQFATASERKTAISSSKKPHAMLIDFVGNSGRHKLINGLDLLGGKYTEAERRIAKEIIADGDIHDIEDALEDARDAIIAKEMAEREMQKQLEEARKRKLVAKAKWTSSRINPFDAFDIRPVHPSVNQRHPLTSKQKDILRKQGIDPDKMSNDQAKQLLDEQFRRWNKDLCSVKQSALLNSHGYDGANMKRDQAKRIIDALAKNRWKSLPSESQFSVARNRVTAKPISKNEW